MSSIAYLAVSLNDQTKDALTEIQGILKINADEKGLAWSPFEWNQLHMTFFFCGEDLNKLPVTVLKRWHQSLLSAIQSIGDQLADCEMRLVGLDVFPPGKNNLIVARFDVSPALRQLHKLVIETAELEAKNTHGVSGTLFRNMLTKNSDREWSPHCTLGKLHAPRGTVANHAAVLVHGVSADLDAARVFRLLSQASTDGLIMGGSKPKQAWIDWKESLLFSSISRA